VHTGIEKTAENLLWQQAITVIDRMDYLAPLSNNLGYVLAVEKLLGVEAPPRAQVVRVMLTELQRIASHLAWLGTTALDIGAQSIFFYAFDAREGILDLFEEVAGVRMHQSYFRIGGLAWDIPPGFEEKVAAYVESLPERLAAMRAILDENPIWVDRMRGVGVISPEDALAWGVTGPNLRACGVDYDVRKAFPYCGYEQYDFQVPLGRHGDAYDRYEVRMREMEESGRIVAQTVEKLPEGPFRIDDRKIVLPPKHEVRQSMESLIHHFKLASYGFDVPAGEVYQALESPRGEIGFYVVSSGENKPWRVRVRGPAFYHVFAMPTMMRGELIADMVAIIASVDPVLGEVDR